MRHKSRVTPEYTFSPNKKQNTKLSKPIVAGKLLILLKQGRQRKCNSSVHGSNLKSLHSTLYVAWDKIVCQVRSM